MAYIVQRKDRFYVVAYDGIDSVSGRERRRWHPAGHSRADAEAIEARLAKDFLREPNVAVEVETYRPFFVYGEVTQGGQYPYVAGMTAEQAIAIAGGYTPRANRHNVQLARRDSQGVVRVSVPLTTIVQPGDTVYVKERWF